MTAFAELDAQNLLVGSPIGPSFRTL